MFQQSGHYSGEGYELNEEPTKDPIQGYITKLKVSKSQIINNLAPTSFVTNSTIVTSTESSIEMHSLKERKIIARSLSF